MFFKKLSIYSVLSVNFKKGHWFDFLADVSLFFTGGTDDWAERDADSLKNILK
jgi:hypothetical protein